MPSSSRKRFHKTLGFRLTFWYSSIFILSSLTLSIVSFAFVFSTMRDNRKAIQLKLAEYRSLADATEFRRWLRHSPSSATPAGATSFFVRVVAPGNKTVLLSNPRLWEEFDFMRFDDWQTENNGIISLKSGHGFAGSHDSAAGKRSSLAGRKEHSRSRRHFGTISAIPFLRR